MASEEDLRKVISTGSELEIQKIELEFKAEYLDREITGKTQQIESTKESIRTLLNQIEKFNREIQKTTAANVQLEKEIASTIENCQRIQNNIQVGRIQLTRMKQETTQLKTELQEELNVSQQKLQKNLDFFRQGLEM